MKIKGLDGRIHVWKLVGNNNSKTASGPHKRARVLLKSIFPLDPLIEELKLPGTKNLRADFFLPKRRIMVEVNGVQHDEFNAHFHGNRFAFFKSMSRDSHKQSFCELNGIALVVLNDGDDEDEWRKSILEAVGGLG